MVCDFVDWINVAHDRHQRRTFVNTVTNLQVPKKAENLPTSWATISFSSRAMFRTVSYVFRLYPIASRSGQSSWSYMNEADVMHPSSKCGAACCVERTSFCNAVEIATLRGATRCRLDGQTDSSLCSELLNVVGGGWLQIPNTSRYRQMRKKIINGT
jgi:hypothetical protein